MKKNLILLIAFCTLCGLSYFWSQTPLNSPQSSSDLDLSFQSELLPILKNFQTLENQTHLEKAAFLQHETQADPQFISKIARYLVNLKDIKEEDKDTILLRTAAINILEELLRLKSQTQITEEVENSLRLLIVHEIPQKSSGFTQRLSMTEKFEFTLILARHHPLLAQKALQSISNPQIRAPLKQALMTGVLEAGLSEKDALLFLRDL